LFTWLIYYGTAHLNRREEEVWLTPFGFLMDLITCHRIYNGLAKPKREIFIDEIIPFGV
jgi:hypothetical protein